ncbi:MAG: DNA polymerase III subunit gamma/tau [Gammaproteobacteria bacterium]|nr:DNA polymerase III subunit gamma/tau [Gammaproteobacteria bacterium]
MSYTVLARKWRPRQFDEMIGQEHVLRALINSLDNDRLHHAYLFTGTRGVGKTTVARVLAKALNCETGITARPCGECRACTEIDRGRFVDLIEVDAASRTKVDDTRELLDNVQYAPTSGRFKVYLIDEVHMLSTHSFNALLKTLEEPPPHVKFLLATTDPQKLPVTVLSRCLQFNLKRLQPAALVAHLQRLCGEEGVAFEARALELIAASAQGSVRDSLSLLDQAIAYGGGKVTDSEVAEMLGTIDRDQVLAIVQALAAHDGRAVLAQVAAMDERAPDYAEGLQALASLLQRIAVMQLVDPAIEEGPERAALAELAIRMSAEDVQLCYQIALLGRRELALAADQRGAFEMTLLRMLAMRPAGGASGTQGEDQAATPARAAGLAGGGASRAVPAGSSAAAAGAPVAAGALPSGSVQHSRPAAARKAAPQAPARPASAPGRERGAASAAGQNRPAAQGDDIDWRSLIAAAGLRGAALQLANHCALLRCEGALWHLALDESGAHMNTGNIRGKLEAALGRHLARRVELRISSEAPPAPTPAHLEARERDERLQAARDAIAADPNVQALQETFGATLDLNSVEPLQRKE